MHNNNDTLPKKNPLGFQIDLKHFELATSEEKAQQDRMRESTTFFKDGMKRLWKNKIAMTSFFIIVSIVLIVTIVPVIYPYSYEQQLGITPGQPIDSSYNNLKPFRSHRTEKA